MKNILFVCLIVCMAGCGVVVQPKYKVGDMIVTKVDDRKGIITCATGSMYEGGSPFYMVRFAARTEDVTTTEFYESVGMSEFEIVPYDNEKKSDQPTEGNENEK